MRKIKKWRVAALFLLCTITTQRLTAAVYSERSGMWNDPETWHAKRVPGGSDEVYLMHTVVAPGTVKCAKLTLLQETEQNPPGKLLFSGEQGNIYFDCDSIIVQASASVHIATDVGVYFNCGGIKVLPETFTFKPLPAGIFKNDAPGLNMSCGGIDNSGVFEIRTSNYLTVKGDISYSSTIVYTGNAFNFYGNSIVQKTPTATFNVAGLTSYTPASEPLYIGGTVLLKNCRFNNGGRELRPKPGMTAKIVADGGYFVATNLDSVTFEGRNGFYISDGIYKNTLMEGVVELAGWNIIFGGKTVVEATLQPKEYSQPTNQLGQPFGANEILTFTDSVILKGALRDTMRLQIELRINNYFENKGNVHVCKINAYSSADIVNYGSIGAKWDSYFNGEFNLSNANTYYDTPQGSATFANSGTVTGKVVFDTKYAISSGTGVGYWMGTFMTNQLNKATFTGSHSFDNSYISHFKFDSNADLVLLRTCNMNYVTGNGTPVRFKSPQNFLYANGFSIYGSGKITLMGDNSGSIIANDSLVFQQYKSGWDVMYPSFTGTIENYGDVVWGGTWDLYTFSGEWINNGTIKNNGSIKGTLVNNGNVEAELNIDGNLFHNGTWANNYSKSASFGLSNFTGETYFWLVKPQKFEAYCKLNSTWYGNKWWKNGQIDNSFNPVFSSVGVSDTGIYQAQNATNATFSGKMVITVRNPFGFVLPAATKSNFESEVKFAWHRVPGATGYKVRLTTVSDKNNQEYDMLVDSVMNGDTTLVLNNLDRMKYKVYLSVQFGYENHYTWSQESMALNLNNGVNTAIHSVSKAGFSVYPCMVKAGSAITINGADEAFGEIWLTSVTGVKYKVLHNGLMQSSVRLVVPSNISTGIYNLTIATSKGQMTQKIVVL